MTQRLQEDHDNASSLAKFLTSIPNANWKVVEPQTNIVKIECKNKSAKAIYDELKKINIKSVMMDRTTIRVVTHSNISGEDIEEVKTRIENHRPLLKLIQSA